MYLSEYLASSIITLSFTDASNISIMDIWAITGVLVGVIGIILAIVFYKKSKMEKKLSYHFAGMKIISSDNSELSEEVEILFKGNKVIRLNKTYLFIWNSGKSTIYGRDIVHDDPLRIEFNENTSVMKVGFISKVREVNNINFIYDFVNPNKIILGFDFLDNNDGAILEILHTDNDLYPKIKGTICGLKNNIVQSGTSAVDDVSSFLKIKVNTETKFRKGKKNFDNIMLFFIGSTCFFSAIKLTLDYSPEESSILIIVWLYILGSMAYILLILTFIFRTHLPKIFLSKDNE